VTDRLPVVDISPFLDPRPSDAEADMVAAAIDQSCREIGFFLVAGHGIDLQARADMLAAAREFFDLPIADKEALAIGRSDCHRGYVGLATETLDADTLAGDLKETLDTGIEHGPDHPEVVAGTPLHGPNQLPDLPGFREAFERYQAQAIAAAEAIQRAMARSLGLDHDFFASLPGETMYNLRLIHYPPQTTLPPADGQLGCGAHSDYGTLTVLTDDGVGGLQVMRRDGRWLDVTVPPATVVVNLGDLMAIWTNDRWVSTPHRVVNPPDVDRYSLPLFVTPPFHAEISCVPSCLAPGETPRYEPLVSGPYLLSRFDSTHSYRNELLEAHNRSVTAAYR
jgi:isopenicillin N synthase-like dioxygenase